MRVSRFLPLVLLGACSQSPDSSMMMMNAPNLDALMIGLTDATRQDYQGNGDGGLAHITYWTLMVGSPTYNALPASEQAKVTKIQANVLHSAKLQPTALVAGTEITGTLIVHDSNGLRQQELDLKLPQSWNGELVVAGTPSARNEFASEAILAPWLLTRGYAYVSGNKGMTNNGADGNTTLLGKNHMTQYWGLMMHDLAAWASQALKEATGNAPARVYAVGLSNGGYQVRRALEIDHQRVQSGQPRQFAGGIDWAGVYWPDARVLGQSPDGTVSPAKFASATHLVSSLEQAALAMGYEYDPGSLTNPTAYKQTPMFSAAQSAMQAVGFTEQSSVLWGAYDMLYDAEKATTPILKGIGYYNLTAYYYRADLLGDDAQSSAPYAIWAPAAGHPAFYDYVGKQPDDGWTADSVTWALKNATTGEFSAPMISVQGDRDALLGLNAHGQAYDAAVQSYGTPSLHRLYVVQNGNHVDAHADGNLDYDCNGVPGDEGAADLLTPMQPYVERAFDYLVAWVEHNTVPTPSKTIPTDPKNDVLDASQITF